MLNKTENDFRVSSEIVLKLINEKIIIGEIINKNEENLIINLIEFGYFKKIPYKEIKEYYIIFNVQ